MDGVTVVAPRPFHESIVDAINRASHEDMGCLGRLIRETKIPKGHDQIIEAIDVLSQGEDMSWGSRELKIYLQEQKEGADRAWAPAIPEGLHEVAEPTNSDG